MAGFTLLPYVKVLYRLRNDQFYSIQRNLGLIGIGTAGLGVPLMLGILWWLYGFAPEWPHLIWGILYVWPMYVYTTAIYHNYKHHRERSLLHVYVAGTLVNAGLNVWLLPVYGITGALAASAVAQWLMMGWLLWLQRGIRVE
jgi:PST family polysaccharide transporter